MRERGEQAPIPLHSADGVSSERPSTGLRKREEVGTVGGKSLRRRLLKNNRGQRIKGDRKVKQKTFQKFMCVAAVVAVLLIAAIGGYYIYRNVKKDAEENKKIEATVDGAIEE